MRSATIEDCDEQWSLMPNCELDVGRSSLSTRAPTLSDMSSEASGGSNASSDLYREVQKAMHRASLGVQETTTLFDSGFSSPVRLQEAARNYGHVERMVKPGGGFAAVKVMPNEWVTDSAADFDRAHPQSMERPWLDIGVSAYLHREDFPYVVQPLGIFRDDQHTLVVSELATEGDLFCWCERLGAPGGRREAALKPVARQIVSAVSWLHDVGVAHRDLSLENVLLTRDSDGELRVKLIDFGMATLARFCRNEPRGKEVYSAPEMFADRDYDAFLTDSFAVGVLLYNLSLQTFPWKTSRPGVCKLFAFALRRGFGAYLQIRQVGEGDDRSQADVLSQDLVRLLGRLIVFKPEVRATLGEQCWNKSGAAPRADVWDEAWLSVW